MEPLPSGQSTCTFSSLLYSQYVVISLGEMQDLIKKDRKEARF